MLNLSKGIEDLDPDRFQVLKTLKTPKAGRMLSRALIGSGLLFSLFLFLPWQQNIRGQGKVTAFSPQDRPQTIESAIAGRISSWKIREGEFVQSGDTILSLSEIKEKYLDPDLLLRIEQQINGKTSSIQSKRMKAEALRNQIAALEDAFRIKKQQAQNGLAQARFRLVSDSVDYEAEKIRLNNARNQFERNEELYTAGNIALTKFQQIESKYQESRMKMISAENKFLESQNDLIIATVEISGVDANYRDKISKVNSELNETLSGLYESEAGLAKVRNEFSNMEIRNRQYQITAPQSGYIVKTLKAGLGETIKEGEAVATIMPSSPEVAVEVYVKAMDVPLIAIGREARIQFDGWPALQFSGWPSVSVGTFGGIVQVVDYVSSTGGQFRLLVTPDPDQEAWPEQLRLGSGTKGWVMLENVPIWYEIWRQLNGFPASIYSEPLKTNGVAQQDSDGSK